MKVISYASRANDAFQSQLADMRYRNTYKARRAELVQSGIADKMS